MLVQGQSRAGRMQDLNPLLLTPALPGRRHIQTEAQGQWDEGTTAEGADG